MVKSIRASQKDQSIEYIDGSPAMLFQIRDFIQLPACYKEMRYEAMMAGGQALPKEYFIFKER